MDGASGETLKRNTTRFSIYLNFEEVKSDKVFEYMIKYLPVMYVVILTEQQTVAINPLAASKPFV